MAPIAYSLIVPVGSLVSGSTSKMKVSVASVFASIPMSVAQADPRAVNPEHRLDSSEIRDEVRKALAQLSPRAAEIFVLRYFEGYDNHEIARMLGNSRSTVAVILHRARQRVRDAIRPYVVGEER